MGCPRENPQAPRTEPDFSRQKLAGKQLPATGTAQNITASHFRPLSSMANPFCTGGVPCRKCCESHTTCVIDHETDNRRKIMFMRKISALEDTIAKILETLRDEEKSEWFIPLVRNNTSTAEIQQILAKESSKDTSSELSTEPEAISLKEGDGRVSRPSDIRGIMAIEHLI
ncbi:hypothetical protein BJX64DRAFT_287985 [Aspergillus heterothallicus]